MLSLFTTTNNLTRVDSVGRRPSRPYDRVWRVRREASHSTWCVQHKLQHQTIPGPRTGRRRRRANAVRHVLVEEHDAARSRLDRDRLARRRVEEFGRRAPVWLPVRDWIDERRDESRTAGRSVGSATEEIRKRARGKQHRVRVDVPAVLVTVHRRVGGKRSDGVAEGRFRKRAHEDIVVKLFEVCDDAALELQDGVGGVESF